MEDDNLQQGERITPAEECQPYSPPLLACRLLDFVLNCLLVVVPLAVLYGWATMKEGERMQVALRNIELLEARENARPRYILVGKTIQREHDLEKWKKFMRSGKVVVALTQIVDNDGPIPSQGLKTRYLGIEIVTRFLGASYSVSEWDQGVFFITEVQGRGLKRQIYERTYEEAEASHAKAVAWVNARIRQIQESKWAIEE